MTGRTLGFSGLMLYLVPAPPGVPVPPLYRRQKVGGTEWEWVTVSLSLILLFRGANPRSDKKLRPGKSMLWALPATAGGTGQPTRVREARDSWSFSNTGACLAGQTWTLSALLCTLPARSLGGPKATCVLLKRPWEGGPGPTTLPGGKRQGKFPQENR